jgi:hypothetical protein
MDEPQGLVESSFVRKDFYLEPPQKDATVEVWQEWLKKDRAAAIVAKRQHTQTLTHADIPESAQAKVVSKIGGVYRQSAMVGFVSEGTDSSRIEVAIEADQDRVVLRPWDHIGGRGVSTTKRRNNSKRAKLKAARKARKS